MPELQAVEEAWSMAFSSSCPRGPVRGAARRGAAALRPMACLASSATPPMAPITLAASSGIKISF